MTHARSFILDPCSHEKKYTLHGSGLEHITCVLVKQLNSRRRNDLKTLIVILFTCLYSMCERSFYSEGRKNEIFVSVLYRDGNV